MQSSRSELKTGKRPPQQEVRSYKDGDVLFSEGSTGRELFIIHEGNVGVYKEGAEGRVRLAAVDHGGLIGEMSLLDALPRSATVIAQGKVMALVVGYDQFQTVMQSVPLWLQSIIKIVVSRLRDANRRVDQSVLRDRDRGIVSLLFLLLPVYSRDLAGKLVLPYQTVITETSFVCRIKRKDVIEHLKNLEKRSLISLFTTEDKTYIHVPDRDLLHLYDEFLLLKGQKKSFREWMIPLETIGVLSNIAYIAQKRGRETPDGTHLQKKILVEDITEKDTARLDKHLTDLSRRGLIAIIPSETGYDILFRKETLSRIKKIKQWVPRFEMEV